MSLIKWCSSFTHTKYFNWKYFIKVAKYVCNICETTLEFLLQHFIWYFAEFFQNCCTQNMNGWNLFENFSQQSVLYRYILNHSFINFYLFSIDYLISYLLLLDLWFLVSTCVKWNLFLGFTQYQIYRNT